MDLGFYHKKMKTNSEPMTNSNKKRILLVSSNKSIRDLTHEIIQESDDLELIEREINSKNIFSVVDETRPNIILFDLKFQKDPHNLISEISSKHPTCALIAFHSQSEIVDTNRILESGAHGLISFPYQLENLNNTINRVINQIAQVSGESNSDILKKTTKTFTVFSPKGGVGTTTISINLAIGLQKRLREDVLLLDGKNLFGHIALYCNIHTGNSIADLIAHAGALDDQLIKQVVVKHTSGIHVLPSPTSFVEAQSIKPEDLFKVVSLLQTIYPYIVIDGGNFLNENAVTHMDLSDKILLVLNPEIASMRDAKQFVEISASLSYPKSKTLIILNSMDKKSDMKVDEIENILKMKIYGMVPFDSSLAISCINEGIPIMSKKPHHPISKAITEISRNLAEMVQTLTDE
jgi:pilus assembly protein CpaE